MHRVATRQTQLASTATALTVANTATLQGVSSIYKTSHASLSPQAHTQTHREGEGERERGLKRSKKNLFLFAGQSR